MTGAFNKTLKKHKSQAANSLEERSLESLVTVQELGICSLATPLFTEGIWGQLQTIFAADFWLESFQTARVVESFFLCWRCR